MRTRVCGCASERTGGCAVCVCVTVRVRAHARVGVGACGMAVDVCMGGVGVWVRAWGARVWTA